MNWTAVTQPLKEKRDIYCLGKLEKSELNRVGITGVQLLPLFGGHMAEKSRHQLRRVLTDDGSSVDKNVRS